MPNPKAKLDLNALLAKYQGSPNMSHYEYYEEVKEPQDFFPSRTAHRFNEHRVIDPIPQVHTQALKGNFQMSKSECEQFLLTVRAEIKSQQNGLTYFAENAMKVLHEKFTQQHEKIRKEILHLLDQAFKENERAIKEEIARHHQAEPVEFSDVHRRMYVIDEEITTMLNKLKSADYRKGIAEVVVRDFLSEMESLRANIKNSSETYLSNLGEVEPERERIECIKRDLTSLFYFNKRTANLVEGALFAAFPGQLSRKQPAPIRESPQRPGRKSFFNFGRE